MPRFALLFMVGLAVVETVPVCADDLDGSWATQHGNLSGTSATTAIPYLLGSGPVEVAWRLDVRAFGVDRVAGRNPITFDSAGNLYWKSSIRGETKEPRVASVSPAGVFRWAGTTATGDSHRLGDVIDGTAVVVGEDAVYAVGGSGGFVAGDLFVAAYGKDDGVLLWETSLPDTSASTVPGTFADLLTPILYQNKIYVVGPDSQSVLTVGLPLAQRVHRIDATSGDLDWSEHIPEIAIPAQGQVAFVPDAFGNDVHGLFFNGDSGRAADGINDVYGVRVDDDGAAFAWGAEGGKVFRSLMIYSKTTGLLYAPTRDDYGAGLYVYDPTAGFITSNPSKEGAAQGFFNVACLDFNETDVITSTGDGSVLRYADSEGKGTTTASATLLDAPEFWGEFRVYGQLVRDADENSILIAGTNSESDSGEGFEARVVAVNVSTGELAWEFNTGIIQDNGFTTRGGPTLGPDGKVYYFDAVRSDLVALDSSARERLPACDVSAVSCVKTASGIEIEWTTDEDEECSCLRYEIRDASGSPVASLAGNASTIATLTSIPCADIIDDGEGALSVVCVGEDGSEAQSTCRFECVDIAGVGPFLRGDCNQDGLNVGAPTDGIFLLNFLFASGVEPTCMAACDFDGDGAVPGTPTDALYFFNFNFLGGPVMDDPLRECEFSEREEDLELGCAEATGCAQ